MRSPTCRCLLFSTFHADHIGDGRCLQPVVLCFIMTMAAHIWPVAAGPYQLTPASSKSHQTRRLQCADVDEALRRHVACVCIIGTLQHGDAWMEALLAHVLMLLKPTAFAFDQSSHLTAAAATGIDDKIVSSCVWCWQPRSLG